MNIITVERKILEKNDTVASELREEFLKRKLFVINLLSSPGSGKTTLIEKLADYYRGNINMAVITGDLQTDNDARRIYKAGVPVIQIVTNGACHLDAMLVRNAFNKFGLTMCDLLIIENVGNLVCPAGFDLGEDMKILLLSTTEGDDKPLKYPTAFRNASVLIINKTDLLPFVNCSISEIERNALSVNPNLIIFKTSCTSGTGINEFAVWLRKTAEQK